MSWEEVTVEGKQYRRQWMDLPQKFNYEVLTPRGWRKLNREAAIHRCRQIDAELKKPAHLRDPAPTTAPVKPYADAMVKRAAREQLRNKAAAALIEAESLLSQLVADYTEAQDGTFSACHPRMGIDSMMRQLGKLRKALTTTRV
ncbi:TPA: hypothetical protein ACGQ50_000810 [Enterobacter cloacae]